MRIQQDQTHQDFNTTRCRAHSILLPLKYTKT